MEMYFGNDNLERCLDVCIRGAEAEEISQDTYKLNMLLENDIPYLIRPVRRSIDEKVWLRFPAGSYRILNELLLTMKADGAFLSMLINQLKEAARGLESYLIPAGDLVLDPTHIFYDTEKKELRLICVPGYGRMLRQQLQELLELLMRRFDHRDQEGVRLLLEVYNDLENDVPLERLGGIREAGKKAPGKRPAEERAPPPMHLPETEEATVPKREEPVAWEREARIRERKIPPVRDLCFFGTMLFMLVFILLFFLSHGEQKYVILCIASLAALLIQVVFGAGGGRDPEEDDPETLDRIMKPYLPEEEPVQRRLIPLTNGDLSEIVPKTDRPLVIGRDKKESDYRLPGERVSRVHAVLKQQENSLLLVDQGSTNGTFINAKRVREEVPVPLSPGDVVSFAGEEFFVS